MTTKNKTCRLCEYFFYIQYDNSQTIYISCKHPIYKKIEPLGRKYINTVKNNPTALSPKWCPVIRTHRRNKKYKQRKGA